MMRSGLSVVFFMGGFLLGSTWMLILNVHFKPPHMGLVFGRLSLTSLTAKDVPEVRREQKHAVIYTMHRSGSTFVGEMFARHPDVYYTYEPSQLYPFFTKNKQAHVNQLGEGFLRELLHCNVCPLIQDVEDFYANGSKRLRSWASPTFCYSVVRKITPTWLSCRKTTPTSCNPYSVQQIQQRCSSKQHVVSKLVTLKNFTSLLPLMQEGVQVIHLVRDPRGQLESIRKVPKYFDLYRYMSLKDRTRHICQVLRDGLAQSLEAIKYDRKVRENYRLVRYEDIAQGPLLYFKRMYDFLGLEESSEVLRWLKKATISGKGILSSEARAWNWRRSISYKDMRLIQAECKDVLLLLGYVPVRSELDLRNLTQSLHGRLPSYFMQATAQNISDLSLSTKHVSAQFIGNIKPTLKT